MLKWLTEQFSRQEYMGIQAPLDTTLIPLVDLQADHEVLLAAAEQASSDCSLGHIKQDNETAARFAMRILNRLSSEYQDMMKELGKLEEKYQDNQVSLTSTDDASQILGVSPGTIRNYVIAGKLGAIKVDSNNVAGFSYRILMDERFKSLLKESKQ